MKIRVLSFLLTLAVALVTVLVLLFSYMQISGVNQLNENWNQNLVQQLEKATNLAQVERALGYVGFIHQFKNYVIRRTESYYSAALISYENTNEALNLLLDSATSSEERQNIETIQTTVNQYRDNLLRAHDQWSELSISELDARVKVDDSPALTALNELRSMLLPGAKSLYRNAKYQAEELKNFTIAGASMTIPLFFLLILFITFSMKKIGNLYSEYQIILESSPDAILYAKANGEILQTNKTAREVFGYNENDFSRLSIEDLVDASLREKHRQHRVDFNTKEQSRNMGERSAQLQGVKKNGQKVELSVAISSVKVEGEIRNIVIARDVTNQKLLEKYASLDHLTQVYNRRAIDQLLVKEISRASRYQRPLSLMLVDIDFFKQLNDEEGHLTGDLAIQSVSQFLSMNCRPSDHLGRWGGDEFLMICPELNADDSVLFAERIRSAFESKQLPWGRKLSLSIGVSTHEDLDGISAKTLIQNTDKALYLAKENGRNAVIHARRVTDLA